MLLKCLGWFWIIIGIIALFTPEAMRHRLQKKSVKKTKRLFFGISLAFGILLIKATWGIPGFLAKLLLFCGLAAIIKAFFLLKTKAAEKIIHWFLKQPTKFFRAAAVLYIVFGALILSV